MRTPSCRSASSGRSTKVPHAIHPLSERVDRLQHHLSSPGVSRKAQAWTTSASARIAAPTSESRER